MGWRRRTICWVGLSRHAADRRGHRCARTSREGLAGLRPAREELADLYRVRRRPVDELSQLQALAALDGNNLPRTVAVGLAMVRNGQFGQRHRYACRAGRKERGRPVRLARARSRVLAALSGSQTARRFAKPSQRSIERSPRR